MSTSPARDDLFTLIHKALRAGLFAAATEAGRIDWEDPVQAKAFRRDWERVVVLLQSHAKHEDDHIWPLLEAKRPGAVAELGIAHEPVDADLDLVDAEFEAVMRNPGPATGLTFYRALTRFIAHAMDHFAAEEPAVMEMMWAWCTDDELAACRSAFMAEISPQERATTFELMLESCTTAELAVVVQKLRAGMPPEAFESWAAELEGTLPAGPVARLRAVLAGPVLSLH